MRQRRRSFDHGMASKTRTRKVFRASAQPLSTGVSEKLGERLHLLLFRMGHDTADNPLPQNCNRDFQDEILPPNPNRDSCSTPFCFITCLWGIFYDGTKRGDFHPYFIWVGSSRWESSGRFTLKDPLNEQKKARRDRVSSPPAPTLTLSAYCAQTPKLASNVFSTCVLPS